MTQTRLVRAERLLRLLARTLNVQLRGGPLPVTPATLNMAQFCEYIGVGLTTGWQLVDTYKVPHTRPTARTVRILKTDADAWLATRRICNAAGAHALLKTLRAEARTDARRTS